MVQEAWAYQLWSGIWASALQSFSVKGFPQVLSGPYAQQSKSCKDREAQAGLKSF